VLLLLLLLLLLLAVAVFPFFRSADIWTAFILTALCQFRSKFALKYRIVNFVLC
jgi:hypothetical protein